ncbi:MAG: sigma-54-dependent Fis family transcriptional regulator [Deltaproteobacteria bacterium]|nr:sigma-54-dependent Fis family transcriptional regulator [Deltaproteobacteria bacterium]
MPRLVCVAGPRVRYEWTPLAFVPITRPHDAAAHALHAVILTEDILMDTRRGVADAASITYEPAAPDTPTPASDARELEKVTGILGRTPAMRLLKEQLVRFAKTTAIVVVHGETGTGKELVARAVHQLSPRAKQPLVAVNIAAFPESLLLSELFGHERGAFTGAIARRRGFFEQADKGTLFLDEIGELMPDAQAALLRVLETREVRPLGAERVRTVDVRLVVATHRDLAEMVRRGLFREDLYYRLTGLLLHLPPLRYRAEEMPLLARRVLDDLAPDHGARRLDPDALCALQEYGWPGNVRQLKNVLRRVVIETEAELISRVHVRAALASEPGAQHEVRDGATTATIAHVLAAEHWNLSQAAKRLGIARSTLRTRIRRAGLVPG